MLFSISYTGDMIIELLEDLEVDVLVTRHVLESQALN